MCLFTNTWNTLQDIQILHHTPNVIADKYACILCMKQDTEINYYNCLIKFVLDVNSWLSNKTKINLTIVSGFSDVVCIKLAEREGNFGGGSEENQHKQQWVISGSKKAEHKRETECEACCFMIAYLKMYALNYRYLPISRSSRCVNVHNNPPQQESVANPFVSVDRR